MTGILSSIDLTTVNTDTVVYQVPTGKSAVVSINICNRTTTSAKVSIAVTSVNSVTAANYIEFEKDVYKPSAFLKSGVLLSSGQYIFVKTTQPNLSINIWGIEK